MLEKIIEKMGMDDYDREAVFMPAAINMVFVVLVVGCTLNDLGGINVGSAWWKLLISMLACIPISALLAKFLMHQFREWSKFIEGWIFKNGLYFPTTCMLLLTDKNTSIGEDLKKGVRAKLRNEHGVKLCTAEKELADEIEARKRAKDAVGIIRQEVAKSGDTMYRRKLIRYGQFRNLLGGALLCFMVMLIALIMDCIGRGESIVFISVVFGLYTIVVITDYFIVRRSAEEYAENLLITYNNLKFKTL